MTRRQGTRDPRRRKYGNTHIIREKGTIKKGHKGKEEKNSKGTQKRGKGKRRNGEKRRKWKQKKRE